MTIETQVLWAPGTPGAANVEVINAFVENLKNQGATDGTYTNTDTPEGRMITRHWTTVNDATTWITYIADYNPISATIIE